MSEKKVLIPLLDRVVVRVETRTDAIHDKFKALREAGFKVPETEEGKQTPDEGTVVALGVSCPELQVGDRVLFGKWAAKQLEFMQNHYVCKFEDIIGVITDEAAADSVRARIIAASS